MPMGDLTPNLAVAAGVMLAGVSLLLCVVGLVSWRRVRAGRLAWIALAFAGFTLEGILLALNAYATRAQLADAPLWDALGLPGLNLLIVLCLYAAVLR